MSKVKGFFRRGQVQKSVEKRIHSLQQKSSDDEKKFTRIAFTFYVIALAAKLANTDKKEDKGTLENEIDSFREIFAIPDSESKKVEAFYSEALNDNTPIEHYASQIRNLFPDNKVLLEELINDLLIFSDADGPLTSKKVNFLKKVVLAFNFNENYFKSILRKHLIPNDLEPYGLLNIHYGISYVDLKKAYRKSVMDCHPDRLAGQEESKELTEIAIDKFRYLTNAYEAIKEKQGFNKKANR